MFQPGYVGDRAQWASYAIHETLYSILAGGIGADPRGNPDSWTRLDGTQLVERTPFPVRHGIRKPRANLRELVDELHTNVTLGLFAVDGLIYLQPPAAAAPNNGSRGDGGGGGSSRGGGSSSAGGGWTRVSVSTTRNVFAYDARALLLTYALAAAAGLAAVAVGVRALAANGVSMTAGFTALLATTRNAALDSLMAGRCLGAEPMPAHVKETELRFGEVIPTQTRSLNLPPQHLRRRQVCVYFCIFRCLWKIQETQL